MPVSVTYIGAGTSGALFEVTKITLHDQNNQNLMSCIVSIEMNETDEFTCITPNEDIADRISGNAVTDGSSFVNASFVINPTSVSDAGQYIVRVAALDDMSSHTTITMTLSASPAAPLPCK